MVPVFAPLFRAFERQVLIGTVGRSHCVVDYGTAAKHQSDLESFLLRCSKHALLFDGT